MFKSIRMKKRFLNFWIIFCCFCHSVAGGGKRHGKVESSSKRTLACLELPNFPDIFPLAFTQTLLYLSRKTLVTIDFLFSVHHFDKIFSPGCNATGMYIVRTNQYRRNQGGGGGACADILQIS